jgi:hypothetical protein
MAGLTTPDVRNWFAGRRLVIATMHGKEQVIAPLLEAALGVQCELPPGFDTDRFGTFSGETDRPADAFQTMRIKCLAGMDAAKADLGIASEGSFGPHPVIPFAAAGEERLICIDRLHGLEIAVQLITARTNFNREEVRHWQELVNVAKQAGFPGHGLILKGVHEGQPAIIKGIQSADALRRAFDQLIQENETLTVETDMRAMCNPTRMEALAGLARLLAEKMTRACPGCAKPGFGEQREEAGLPCAWCGSPTGKVKALQTICTHCGFRECKVFPDRIEEADPGDCPRCNP